MVLGLLGAASNNINAGLPPVRDPGTSAEVGNATKKTSSAEVSVVNAPAISLVYTFGPDTQIFLKDAVDRLAATGTLPFGIPPTVSTNVPQRLAELRPENIMVKGDGKGYVWLAVTLTARPGETVALADGSGNLKSNPTNLLGKTISFAGANYSETAIGIKSDGSRITSGTASQRVNGKVIVLVGYKSFTVNSSSDEIEVRDWFYGNDVSLTSTVSAGGSTATASLDNLPPILTAVLSTNRSFQVFTIPNGDPRTYNIQSAPSVVGPWTTVGDVNAEWGLDFGSATNALQFIRYAP